MEITRRNVLLECLGMMETRLRLNSVNQAGRIPIEEYKEEFYAYEKKCEVLRELIQAYESEPVRNSIANWQMQIMNGEPVTTEDLKRENNG